jgi:hypothetical protein
VEGYPDIVGRDDELGALIAFLERALATNQTMLMGGLPGVGKTTLWAAAASMAEGSGWTVLRARPAEAEAALSFAGLSDLLGEVGEEVLGALPSVQRRALEVALLRTDAGETGTDSRAVCAGALSALRQLASGAPLLVALDDFQWLDRATTGALGFALRRVEGYRVSLLASGRENDVRLPAVTDRLVPGDRAELVLAPLGAAAIREMLDRKFPGQLGRGTAARVAAASGGNPFYATEIAREVVRLGPPPPTEPLPGSDGCRRARGTPCWQHPARATREPGSSTSPLWTEPKKRGSYPWKGTAG